MCRRVSALISQKTAKLTIRDWIDVMWLGGFKFPRYRGGLMYWADGIGVAEVYRQIQAWHQQYGERWAPAALLRQLAESGTPLREAKPSRPM
jgi:3-hydroxyacyl-CoA dehydrogenase